LAAGNAAVTGAAPSGAATAGEAGTGPSADGIPATTPDQSSTAAAPNQDQSAPPATPDATSPPAQPDQSTTAQDTTPSAGHPTVTATPDATTTQPAKNTAETPPARDAAPGVPDHALAGVTGPAPTAATAQTAAPAQPQSAAPPAPPVVQIAMRIAPLRLEADGVHRLTVNLHPADLGPVQVVAEIRNGDVSLQLSGSTDAGTAALRDSLDDLRRELTDAGFGNCELDLRQGDGDARQEQPRQPFSPSRPHLTTPSPIATAAPKPEKGRLDVRA
jgi:flagellar hook-length control protein FliK